MERSLAGGSGRHGGVKDAAPLSFSTEISIVGPFRRFWSYLGRRRLRILASVIGTAWIIVWAFVILAREGAPWYSWLAMTGIYLGALAVVMPIILKLTDSWFPQPSTNGEPQDSESFDADRAR